LSKPSGSVQPHKHCPVCGISISPSKTYCSAEHQQLDESSQKRMKNFRNLTLLLLVVTMIALVGLSLFLRVHA